MPHPCSHPYSILSSSHSPPSFSLWVLCITLCSSTFLEIIYSLAFILQFFSHPSLFSSVSFSAFCLCLFSSASLPPSSALSSRSQQNDYAKQNRSIINVSPTCSPSLQWGLAYPIFLPWLTDHTLASWKSMLLLTIWIISTFLMLTLFYLVVDLL